jgi:stage II sporulation protein D
MLLPIIASAQTIRVGLVRQFKGEPKIIISANADLSVLDSSGNPISVPASEKVTLKASENGIDITRSSGDKVLTSNAIELATSSEALISISIPGGSSAAYHGKIQVTSDGKSLTLVNVVELEDYVRGVLPGEMPSTFKLEALKAQAVAARTYAWANRGRDQSSGYDLCDRVHCQLYCGASGENVSCSKAVSETAGLIMIYDGRPVQSQYCADCGGKTQDGGLPYLVSVIDSPDGGPDYCEHKGHAWSKKWSLGDFGKVLGFNDLSSIKVSEKDCSGRASEVALNAGAGPATTTGAKIRRTFGESVVKSTLFTLDSENGDVIMKGRGFGHGVGMCQRGANGMASSPHNCTFEQILKHYYTGVEIVAVSSVRDQQVLSSRSGGRHGRTKHKKK